MARAGPGDARDRGEVSVSGVAYKYAVASASP